MAELEQEPLSTTKITKLRGLQMHQKHHQHHQNIQSFLDFGDECRQRATMTLRSSHPRCSNEVHHILSAF